MGSVKSCNLNPYWNESFVFIIDEMDMKKVTLDITVCDYDLIGGGDPIGKIMLGWTQNKSYKPGFKHWKEALENPRRTRTRIRMTRRTGIRRKAKRRKVMGRRRKTTKRRKRSRLLQGDKVTIANQN